MKKYCFVSLSMILFSTNIFPMSRVPAANQRLLESAQKGNLEQIKKELAFRGININTKNEKGDTPLLLAIRGYVKAYSDANKYYADREGLSTKGFSNFHYRTFYLSDIKKFKDIIDLLLNKGASVLEKNNSGETAIYLLTQPYVPPKYENDNDWKDAKTKLVKELEKLQGVEEEKQRAEEERKAALLKDIRSKRPKRAELTEKRTSSIIKEPFIQYLDALTASITNLKNNLENA